VSVQWKILSALPMVERMRNSSLLFAVMLMCGTASAQPALRLKGLNSYNAPQTHAADPPKTLRPGRLHRIVQFSHNPDEFELRKLENLGVTILSYIPDYAFSVSVPDNERLTNFDIHWQGALQPLEKISAEFGVNRAALTAVVEFYPDVDGKDARAIVMNSELRLQENADMLPNHLLVRGSREQLSRLADWDEVSYIFPASYELTDGAPVHACAGAMTSQGSVQQAIPVIGDGWDGPGLGSATLNYAFATTTAQLPADSVQAQIARAFAQWSDAVQVTFTPSSNPNGNQTIGILFATGAHGDGYPFIGASTLAHTFYPFPENPEPIAGDMHFNDAETWQIGVGVDLYSVALHEAGHALGLGHSDVPGDVMYPYYRIHTVLMPNDIAAAQGLYAAAGATSPSPAPATAPDPSPTPAPSSPLLLAVIAPPSSSNSSPISISGTVSGGTGTVQVYWNSTSGAFGQAQGSTNWTIPTVPLIDGSNTITITAEDTLMNVASNSVVVNYQAVSPTPAPPSPPNPPAPAPNPTPSGPDTTPPSLTILSPATTNYYTSASSLVVSGTATDNVGVASVTWATSNGTSGFAAGTTNWSTAAIPLYVGSTTVVITATDAAGNTSWRSLTVTRD